MSWRYVSYVLIVRYIMYGLRMKKVPSDGSGLPPSSKECGVPQQLHLDLIKLSAALGRADARRDIAESAAKKIGRPTRKILLRTRTTSFGKGDLSGS